MTTIDEVIQYLNDLKNSYLYLLASVENSGSLLEQRCRIASEVLQIAIDDIIISESKR